MPFFAGSTSAVELAPPALAAFPCLLPTVFRAVFSAATLPCGLLTLPPFFERKGIVVVQAKF